MLHRSNAERSLWKGRDSPGEAAGQSPGGRGGPGGAGTWRRVVFGPARRHAGGREDLPRSLRQPSGNSRGSAVPPAR